MSRLIEHDQQEPEVIGEDEFEEEHGGTVAVCQCGLSDNYPFCDGSHNATSDEEEGKLYRYEGDDDEGERHEVDSIEYAR
ncbi:MAG: CDGSH iron-sulfur domain-containing protein [Halobacteria archaeon]|nr:CDGSH iron-sulfur domain-containing protein [Halobacteria archaeon]